MPKFFGVMTLGALIILGSASLGAPLYGWFDAGHMTVALIAKGELTPATAKCVQEILAFAFDGEQGEDPFLFASVWPDLIKDKGLRSMDSWHYVNAIIASGPDAATREPASLPDDPVQ